MEINDITYKIRGAIFAVYNALGPGLLESASKKEEKNLRNLCDLWEKILL